MNADTKQRWKDLPRDDQGLGICHWCGRAITDDWPSIEKQGPDELSIHSHGCPYIENAAQMALLRSEVVALRSLATRLRDALVAAPAPIRPSSVRTLIADADALLSTTKEHDHA